MLLVLSGKDSGRVVAPAPAPLQLVSGRPQDLSEDLREIRATVRKQQKIKQRNQLEADQRLAAWQNEFLKNAPSLFPRVPAAATCSSASAGAGRLQAKMTWTPPCAELAKVGAILYRLLYLCSRKQDAS